MLNFKKDTLDVKVYDTRSEMGIGAGIDVITEIKKVLSEKEVCRIIFAAAPSQNECLEYLRNDQTVDWSRVECFHMDEYHLLPHDSDKRFGYFLDNAIFKHHNYKKVHYLCASSLDVYDDIKAYEREITKAPVDICLCGIGENGHIAFNEPAYADFNDPKIIKEIELDEVCRYQQLHDAGFASIDDVPRKAITLTIPTLVNCNKLFCVVPSDRKAKAVHNVLYGDVTTSCPASILRTTNNCILYLDKESYGE